jgi:multiple sugar transport system substrate-binding protein
VVGGEDIVLTRSSKNKAAALSFLRFMISPWAQTQMARAGQLPVRKDVTKRLLKINPRYAIFLKQLETAKPRTPHPNWPRIDEALGAAVLSAIKGDKTTKAALDEAARQIDSLLRN